MKKIIFKILIFSAVLLIIGACFACRKVFPENIPFTEYTWAGTSCQGIEFSGIHCNSSQLTVINSNEELKKHVNCSIYPEIDFSKYTLLLAKGVRCYQDIHNYTKFQRVSKRNYVLKVGFRESNLTALRNWYITLIVDKIEQGSSVTLTVNLK